ncbi:MAG: LD-carboxypeptidase [Cytophagaceae bacterium]
MKRPEYLKKGDSVAVVATAKSFSREQLKEGIQILESWGLNIVKGSSIYNIHHQFAGTDEERIYDLQEMLDRKDVKAIFCARGGYGTARVIDQLNFSKFKKFPKWVVGFSDVTVLLNKIEAIGVESVHGPMVLTLGKYNDPDSNESLKKILFGKKVNYNTDPHFLNIYGKAEGKLTGGNLSIICSQIGTASELDTRNKILFIEEVDEYLYRFDRLMVQLKRSGKLKSLKGLIVGQLSDMKDNEPSFGSTPNEIIVDHVKEYKYPVIFGFRAGHEAVNLSLAFGRTTSMNVSGKSVKIIQS